MELTLGQYPSVTGQLENQTRVMVCVSVHIRHFITTGMTVSVQIVDSICVSISLRLRKVLTHQTKTNWCNIYIYIYIYIYTHI